VFRIHHSLRRFVACQGSRQAIPDAIPPTLICELSPALVLEQDGVDGRCNLRAAIKVNALESYQDTCMKRAELATSNRRSSVLSLWQPHAAVLHLTTRHFTGTSERAPSVRGKPLDDGALDARVPDTGGARRRSEKRIDVLRPNVRRSVRPGAWLQIHGNQRPRSTSPLTRSPRVNSTVATGSPAHLEAFTAASPGVKTVVSPGLSSMFRRTCSGSAASGRAALVANASPGNMLAEGVKEGPADVLELNGGLNKVSAQPRAAIPLEFLSLRLWVS
jgi:hypothetical protein